VAIQEPIFKPGTILLDKYLITKFIGRGGFAEVYQARHISLKLWRALKIVSRKHQRLSSTQIDRIVARFRLEAQLGASLNSPFIVRVHDFDETQAQKGLYVLVMEFMPGGSLQERLKRRSKGLPLSQVLRMAHEIAQGLAELHRRNFVHRDIKPANLLFGERGEAKIADLGIIQMPDHRTRQDARQKPHPGTPAYMSPEQQHSSAPLTPASDIYSFGLVLFEALTLQNPKHLKPGTWFSYLRQVRPNLPAWFVDLLQHMLAPEPSKRPWNGDELYQWLMQNNRAPRKARSRESPSVPSSVAPAKASPKKDSVTRSRPSPSPPPSIPKARSPQRHPSTPPPPPPSHTSIDADDLLDEPVPHRSEVSLPAPPSTNVSPPPVRDVASSPSYPSPEEADDLLDDFAVVQRSNRASPPTPSAVPTPPNLPSPPPPPSPPPTPSKQPTSLSATSPTPNRTIPLIPSKVHSHSAKGKTWNFLRKRVSYHSIYPSITALDANAQWVVIGTSYGVQAWRLQKNAADQRAADSIVDRQSIATTAIYLLNPDILLATTMDGRFVRWLLNKRQKSKDIFVPTPTAIVAMDTIERHFRNRLASVDSQGHIYIWRYGERAPLLHFQAGRSIPLGVRWIDHERVTLVESLGRLSLWLIQQSSYKLLGKWRYPARWSAFTVSKPSQATSPKVWVGTTDGQVWQIDVETGRLLQRWKAYKNSVISVHLLDVTHLMTLDQESVVCLWNVEGELLGCFRFPFRNISITHWSDNSPWGRGLWLVVRDKVTFYAYISG